MCGTDKILNKTKTGEQIHTTTTVRNAGEDAAAAPVQEEQPAVVQEVRQQEITEVLPMRHEAVPIPVIPQVLQRRAEPMQQPVPGGQSFKQRRRQKKEDKRLKEQYGEHADHVSAAIKQQLDELTVEREAELARMTSLRDEADHRNVKVEVKVLHSFITGYKTNEEGNPLNEQEAERKRKDDAFLEDYCSGDLQRRLPHLERMKNELLNIRLSPDMLTETYMERHAVELYDIVAKMTYFENVEKDPINAPFFENLPAVERKLLKYRVADLCGSFSHLWICILASKGFTIAGSEAQYTNQKSFLDAMIKQEPATRELLKNQLRELEQKEEELRQETLMEERQQGILTFNEAVQNSMPEPTLDKALGTEADYESLRSLFYDEMYEEERDGEMLRGKGLIALSDYHFEKYGESSALQALKIRESKTEAAKRDKKLRGQFFLDIPKDYVPLFRNMYDAGVDFEAMIPKFKKVSCGMGAYSSGGGIEQVHDKLFAIFQKYIEAPQGQEYVQKMISILENAKVFEGKREKCVNYILQCLLNSFGANFVDVSEDAAYYGEHAQAARTVCRESCRNLLILPRVIQLSGKAKADLPPEIARLGEQYRQLIQQLSQK